jgi:SecD/SecF fusion protein
MTDRRRNLLILLIVLGLLVVSGVVIVTKQTRLGLDLKGGVQLTYKGRPTPQAQVNNESLEHAIDIMRKRVDQLGVAQPEIQRFGSSEISVGLPDVSNAKRAEDEVGKTAQLHFYDWEPNVIGPDGQPSTAGGKSLAEQAKITGGQSPGTSATGLLEYKAVLLAGKRPAIVRNSDTTLGPNCTPAESEASKGPNAGCIYGQWYLLDTAHEKVLRGPEETRANLFADYTAPAAAKVKVVHVLPGTVLAQAQAITTAGGKVTKQSPNSWYVLNDDPVLSGSDIQNPRQSFGNGGSGQPSVTFEFISSAKKVWERTTKKIAERGREAQLPGVSQTQAYQHFAIVLDGQLIAAPFINYSQYPEGIDASTGSEISDLTLTEAENLTGELQSGALPIKLELISQSQVSATLGKTALEQGLVAGLAGFVVVCLFLLTFYRVLGVVAIGGLFVYGVYFYALIKLIPITMTLPGIAGMIITIGIAADANIVIFERVKEEIRAGRSILAGIASGYRRGFAAIVDANVVTFMTAFILFALATAEVQGFAFTLGIGTLASLFTAVLATRAALGAMGRSRLVSHPAMLGAGTQRHKWSFDFMGASKWFFSLSGCILLIGALAIGGKGLNFGIDFKSGTRIQTAFATKVSENQVQKALSSAGYPDAEVQKFSSSTVGGQGFQISMKRLGPIKSSELENALDSKFKIKQSKTGTPLFSKTSIGPTFGQTVANSAIIAIIASLLVISIYIALRFEWKYAVPVLIALMHDLLITSGVYALTGREVTSSTVAALLTILGYSLYDTIIVFDRVRENVPRMPRAAFSQIVNRSMSEVLTRSLATSLCTLLPVLALLLFGGATLKDFAFALMVGIASGAYSSIFIASPVLTHWKEREVLYANRRNRIVRDLGAVPAYATALGDAPVDVEPPSRSSRRRGGFLADDAGEEISREEFQELVADLDVEPKTDAAAAPGRGARPGAGQSGATAAPPQKPAKRDPAADLTPEELVLKDEPKRSKPKRPRNRKHGRSR